MEGAAQRMRVPDPRTPLPTAAYRAYRLAGHLLLGLFVVAALYPHWTPERRDAVKRRWSARLLRILNIAVEAPFRDLPSGTLLVANHISWLDIFAINALSPACFVAKAEVRAWPVIGWLTSRTNTLFLRRNSARDAKQLCTEIANQLRRGQTIMFFPEGSSTDGTLVLPFRSALFQAAIDAKRQVLPIALSYHDARAQQSLLPAYAGDTSLFQSVMSVLSCRSLTVRLQAAPALSTEREQRNDLAAWSHEAIAKRLFSTDGFARCTEVTRSADANVSIRPTVPYSWADGLKEFSSSQS